MTTTLTLPDPLMAALERRAAERGLTPDRLIEELVRRGLADELSALPPGAAPELKSLPTFRMGAPLVDLDDKDAMDEVLNGERDRRLYGRRPPGGAA